MSWFGFVRRRWFYTLSSGLLLFLLVQQVFMGTGNPNYVPTLLLLGAFLTPVAFVTYIYERGPAGSIPLETVALCFFWGGVLGTVAAGVLEYQTLRQLGMFALFGVGLIEEAVKLIVPLAIYVHGRHRTEADGLVFGVAAGMGFAALETMGYGFVALLQSQGNLGDFELTLLVRGLLAPAGHAAWTGLVCAVAWRERERAGRPVINRAVVGAFVVAVLLHALWDIFNSVNGPNVVVWLGLELFSLAVAVTSLTLLVRRVREASRAYALVGGVEG